jgi:G3E family GTPase
VAVRLTVPVTIVTGFLGSGKTTLVNRILREPHGARIAVVENEFGEVGVDAEFLTRTGDETIVQLANGCLCCNVRGDLAKALQEIAATAQARDLAFDRVLIETTGLADPGPVIQTFLAETSIEAFFHLDGVVALVDARHAAVQADRLEFRAQVAYADRIVVSMADLVSATDRTALENELATLNPRAPVVACNLHAVAIDTVLAHVFDTRGFSNDYVPPEEIRRALGGLSLSAAGGGRMRPVGAARHTQDVRSCVYTSEAALDLDALNAAIDAIVAHYGARLWRCKGIVLAEGRRSRLVIQGVQGLVQISGGTLWRPFELRRSVLVFIGQGLETDRIVAVMKVCESAAAPAAG